MCTAKLLSISPVPNQFIHSITLFHRQDYLLFSTSLSPHFHPILKTIILFHLTMLNSYRACFISLNHSFKKLITRIKSLGSCTTCCKKSKRRRFFSDLSWLASSSSALEVSNQLKQVFQFIDSNGDGKISELELSQVLLSLGHEKSVAEKEAEGMVREMDCDGDGFVDLDEFMKVMEVDEAEDEDEAVLACCKEEELAKAFLVFDADKNGVISPKELQSVLVSLGCGSCSLRQCRRMIKHVDKDGDGLVNFEEFKCMMALGCNISNK